MHPLFGRAHSLSAEVIGAAIEVHRIMGPGLLQPARGFHRGFGGQGSGDTILNSPRGFGGHHTQFTAWGSGDTRVRGTPYSIHRVGSLGFGDTILNSPGGIGYGVPGTRWCPRNSGTRTLIHRAELGMVSPELRTLAAESGMVSPELRLS